jgi:hypothetical protein
MKSIRALSVLSLVAAVAFAQPGSRVSRVTDDVPLKNWKVAHREAPIQSLADPSDESHFISITPCRLVDTRGPVGPYGGPVMASGETRSFDLDSGPCSDVQSGASAYSLNFTVAQPTGQGNLAAWPTGTPKPSTSTLNYQGGVNLANAAIVRAGTSGSIDVSVTTQTHVVIDINGYFVEAVVTNAAGPTRITPSNLAAMGWEAWPDLCVGDGVGVSEIEFTNGEDRTPPLGTGSFQVTSTGDGSGGALATQNYDGLTIGQLTTLHYSTRASDVADQPYIYIKIDGGDTIYFFPANQQAAQGATKIDRWQSWDALNGLWNLNGDGGPSAALPLSTYAARTIEGVRIASGCGGPTPDTRVRATDAFEIGVDGANAEVFDFERN